MVFNLHLPLGTRGVVNEISYRIRVSKNYHVCVVTHAKCGDCDVAIHATFPAGLCGRCVDVAASHGRRLLRRFSIPQNVYLHGHAGSLWAFRYEEDVGGLLHTTPKTLALY